MIKSSISFVHRPYHRKCLQKWRSLSLWAFANCNLGSLCFFWSNGFFLREWLFSPSRYRTCFTVDNDTLTGFSQHLHKVFCFSSWVDMHISEQSTFFSVTQNLSLSRVVWWLDTPMVFILAYNCLKSWTWHLQATGNCTVHTFLSDIWADLLSNMLYQVCLKIHPQVCLQLTQMLSRIV